MGQIVTTDEAQAAVKASPGIGTVGVLGAWSQVDLYDLVFPLILQYTHHMTWIRKRIGLLHSIAVLAIIANIGVSMSCCMAQANTTMQPPAMVMQHEGSAAHGASSTGHNMGHNTGHEQHKSGECDCLEACTGVAPTLPAASHSIDIYPLAKFTFVMVSDQQQIDSTYSSVHARAPPHRA